MCPATATRGGMSATLAVSCRLRNIVGERSSTDFGMVFGGGAQFGVVFAELRYHYIWGPEVEQRTIGSTTVTKGGKANGQFLQVSFGVRF